MVESIRWDALKVFKKRLGISKRRRFLENTELLWPCYGINTA